MNITLTDKEMINLIDVANFSKFNSKETKGGSNFGVTFSVNGISVYGNAYGMKEKGEGLEKLIRTDTNIF